jgi:hypothetical protein
MSQQAIKDALRGHGPMTSKQIGARIQRGPSSVSQQLTTLRGKGEVYISDWILLASNKPGRNAPIYSLGSAADVACKKRGAQKVKPKTAQKVCAYADARKQAGMWGGLICSA